MVELTTRCDAGNVDRMAHPLNGLTQIHPSMVATLHTLKIASALVRMGYISDHFDAWICAAELHVSAVDSIYDRSFPAEGTEKLQLDPPVHWWSIHVFKMVSKLMVFQWGMFDKSLASNCSIIFQCFNGHRGLLYSGLGFAQHWF